MVGTNAKAESEGYDRESLALPGRQDELVAAAPTSSGSSPTRPDFSGSPERSSSNNTTNGKPAAAATSPRPPWPNSSHEYDPLDSPFKRQGLFLYLQCEDKSRGITDIPNWVYRPAHSDISDASMTPLG